MNCIICILNLLMAEIFTNFFFSFQYTELQSNSDETKTELETTFNETKTLCMSLKEKLENASINNSTEENEKQLEALTDQLKESDENVSKLETQVKKYQDLLKVTVSICT